MSTSPSVHATQNLDVTQAEYIHDLAKLAKDGLQELYSRWYVLGASGIDVVVRVGSLAFFTAIAMGAAYSIFSRQPGRAARDTVANTLLCIVALWWTSAAASAVTVLSRALQRYYRLASDMGAIADQLDGVIECAGSASDCAYAFHYHNPVYTYAMDRCVGTMAVSAKAVAMEAFVCVFLWGLLKSGTARVVKGGILALSLASSVSAAVHTKRACWPGPVPAESKIPPWNVVEEDVETDSTTSRLFWATVVLGLWLGSQRLWENRHIIRDGPPAHDQSAQVSPKSRVRRPVLVYAVPLCALLMLTLVREALWDPRNLVEYAVVSWINGFCFPLLGLCPCVLLLAYCVTSPDDGGMVKVESTAGDGGA
ncbi:hypothetical protein C8T65DRAFT_750815 [Cerioporus squamosus]|nr:hypothetical protein C8T65DRAFT_750815 [Cerioporus squamosus]